MSNRIRFDPSLFPPNLDYPYFELAGRHPFSAVAETFRLENAWWLAEASFLAYADAEDIRRILGETTTLRAEPFAVANAQGFVARGDGFRWLVLRGTEVLSRETRETLLEQLRELGADLATNARARLRPWPQGGRVHQGFRDAFAQVVDEIGALLSRDAGLPTWFAGHSQGGAIAALAADHFGAQGLYTFGCPRPGDARFARRHARGAYRIVNNNDFVTRLPPPLAYRHVGQLRYLASRGRLRREPGRWSRLFDGLRGSWLEVVDAARLLRRERIVSVPIDHLTDHSPQRYAGRLKALLGGGAGS